jgi:DNA-directed RNA polymerase specialized sigma24 family protein
MLVESSTTVFAPPMPPVDALTTRNARLDAESRAWLDRLAPDSREREAAVGALHALLLKAARFEVNRRRAAYPHLRPSDCDDLAHQSADDALVAVLGKLDDFRGDSRFTTWAYKFALFEAGVKARRRAWQGREVHLEPESWALIARDLSPHQRQVPGRRDDRGRADRRPRRAAGHDARRALQDHPRRPPQAA